MAAKNDDGGASQCWLGFGSSTRGRSGMKNYSDLDTKGSPVCQAYITS